MENKSTVRTLGYAVGAGVLLVVLLLVLCITTGVFPWRDSYAENPWPFEQEDSDQPTPSDVPHGSVVVTPTPTPTPTPVPTPLITPEITLDEELPTYIVTVAFSKGGSAIPYGANTVVENGSMIVVAVPDEGYAVEEMIVDGVNIGPVDRYEIESVNRNHSIYISFVPEMFAPTKPTPTPTSTPVPEVTPTPTPVPEISTQDSDITE